MAEFYQINMNKRRNIFFSFSLTFQVILVTTLIYIATLIISSIYGEEFLISNFALTPLNIIAGKKLWTLITSIFLHASFFRLFANMFSLFFVGIFLERIIGKRRFFLVYITAGILGGVFFVLSGLIFKTNLPGVGSSGAIFGLLGVLAVLVPFSRIYLILGPLIVMILQVVFAGVVSESYIPIFNSIMNILIFIMIFAMFSFNTNFRKIALPVELPMWLLPIIAIIPLTILSFFIFLPIGNSAHFGGLVVGLIYGFYLRNKYPKKIKYISRVFSNVRN